MLMNPSTIVVVSGLPRSGTSLMMQMLGAGGVPLLEDDERAPDDDNPRGYLEYARTKQLWQDASWLQEAVGKAVKIVSPLLPALPFDHDFRVVLMQRNMAEVVASQTMMLRRRGEAAAQIDSFPDLVRMLRWFKCWVRYQPNFRWLEVEYQRVLDAPAEAAARVERFLGIPLDCHAMVGAVEPALHRQRVPA